MPNSVLYSSIYLRFLNLARAIRELPDAPDLDPVEERLLNLFASVWYRDQKITVLQAMGMSSDISSTTAHRRLKSLRAKGMISLAADETDNRVKYVQPTALAQRYFAQMGQCVEQAQTP
ncbi:MAG: winged helix-turn-helix domain-containing protein [Betaproteobacteria bacterium]